MMQALEKPVAGWLAVMARAGPGASPTGMAPAPRPFFKIDRAHRLR